MSVCMRFASKTLGNICIASPWCTVQQPHESLYDSRMDKIDIGSRAMKLTMDTCALSRFEQQLSFPVNESGNRLNILVRQ